MDKVKHTELIIPGYAAAIAGDVEEELALDAQRPRRLAAHAPGVERPAFFGFAPARHGGGATGSVAGEERQASQDVGGDGIAGVAGALERETDAREVELGNASVDPRAVCVGSPARIRKAALYLLVLGLK